MAGRLLAGPSAMATAMAPNTSVQSGGSGTSCSRHDGTRVPSYGGPSVCRRAISGVQAFGGAGRRAVESCRRHGGSTGASGCSGLHGFGAAFDLHLAPLLRRRPSNCSEDSTLPMGPLKRPLEFLVCGMLPALEPKYYGYDDDDDDDDAMVMIMMMMMMMKVILIMIMLLGDDDDDDDDAAPLHAWATCMHPGRPTYLSKDRTLKDKHKHPRIYVKQR